MAENNDCEEPLLEPCAEGKASCCSKSFYTWVNPLIKMASLKALQATDLPDILDTDKADLQRQKFLKAWNTQQGKPDIVKVLRSVYGKEFAKAGFVKLGHDILQYVVPILLWSIISFIENGSTSTFLIFGTHVHAGFIYAFLLFFGQILQNFFLNAYFHRCYRIGMQARACVVSAIYEKSLRVSMSEQHGASTGAIVNLMSNDANRIMRIASYGHNLWSAPFQVITAFTLLMLYIGPSCIVGILVVLISIPTKKYLANKMIVLRKGVINMTEQRVKLINDVLQGIRVIKLYAWENSFLTLISNIRKKEMVSLNKVIFVNAINTSTWNLTPILVAMSTFAVYAYTGGEMRASLIFTALALFTRIQFPLSVFPNMISSLIDFFVAANRITNFLTNDEVEGISVQPLLDDKTNYEQASIKVGADACFSWNHHVKSGEKKKKAIDNGAKNEKEQNNEESKCKKKNDGFNKGKTNEKFLLDDINLHLSSNELIMICGRVGSGKSSLIQAILGEMKRENGNVTIHGSMSYVPQAAWILNKSVKKNVVLESYFDQDKYQNALQASELISDLQILPAGDETEIGEKGINISGGQKQRVALARALYADRDIVLLDDPLSALDVHVGKKVFEKLILERLKDKLVILVTHNLLLLKHADRIIYVENGKILGEGSQSELMASNAKFREFMNDKNEEANDVGDEGIIKDAKDNVVSLNNVIPNINNGGKVRTEKKSMTASEREAGSKMIKAEAREYGGLKFNTIVQYFGSFFPHLSAGWTIFLIILFMTCAQSCNLLTGWWLSWWYVHTSSLSIYI